MRIKIRVSKYEKFGALARRFRDAANGDLQRDAVLEIAGASGPVLARVKAGVLAASFPAVPPATQDWDTPPKHLRATLAAATNVTPLPRGNGVRFSVDGKQVRPDGWGHRLAQLTDKETAPRWRHPTFGDWRYPVMQQGRPWFFANIRTGRSEFEAGVHRAVEKTARKITGGR